MDPNDRREENGLKIDRDTQQINLVVNHPGADEGTIDLGRVFHNMKVKSRIFAWVLILCLVVGICAPLLLYQFSKPMLTVTSVVTLRYGEPNPEYENALRRGDTDALKTLEPEIPVTTLITPEGEELDLSLITSSAVLQKAMSGLTLSAPITQDNIRNNLTITRIMTNDSSRTKEILAGLAEAKNAEVYQRLENAQIEYKNIFIVSLTNGFGDEDSNVKVELKNDELQLLLNRILDAYNDELVREWADLKLPEDEISLIDTEELDIPEVLDNLKTALDNLYAYCKDHSEAVKSYRSWRTGMNLNDWMESIQTIENVSVDYLDAYVFSRGLMRDRDAVRLTFRYRLRTLQSDLDEVNETIATTDELLKNYKNNDVFVSMQESDSARTTKMTTDYYNSLVLRQEEAYSQAADLRIQIAEIQNKLERLETETSLEELTSVEEELANALQASAEIYSGIREHMEELFESPLYTTYTEHSAPQGKVQNFLTASMKKMIIGAVAGAVVACGLWFLAALAPEFRRGREDDEKQAQGSGKEAPEA